jgi:hypothetical protein
MLLGIALEHNPVRAVLVEVLLQRAVALRVLLDEDAVDVAQLAEELRGVDGDRRRALTAVLVGARAGVGIDIDDTGLGRRAPGHRGEDPGPATEERVLEEGGALPLLEELSVSLGGPYR